MNKKQIFIIALSVLLAFGCFSLVSAEQSAASASGKSYLGNQVFTIAQNNSGSDIESYSIVILDTSGTAGSTLGAYITTTTTADSTYVFGVTSDKISDGSSGRVLIRGPHLVKDLDSTHALEAILATSTTAGLTTTYSTADGTTGGYLGHVISATSGDDDYGDKYCWVWVNPQVHD